MDNINNIFQKHSLSNIESVFSITIKDNFISWDKIDLSTILTYQELIFFKKEILTIDLKEFKNLNSFKISVNKDFNFPKTFFSSKSLNILEISGGKISALTKFNLKELKELTLQSVSFSKLNDSILNSEKLIKLNLFYSNIKTLPDDLYKLKNLKSLSVYNKIESIDNVNFPDSLEEIDLRSNKISEINTNLITKKIKKIDVSQNPLFKITISNFTNELKLFLSETPIGCFNSNFQKIREYIPIVFFTEPTYNPINSIHKKYSSENYIEYLNDFYESLNQKWDHLNWNNEKLDDPEYKRPIKIKNNWVTFKKSDLNKTEVIVK